MASDSESLNEDLASDHPLIKKSFSVRCLTVIRCCGVVDLEDSRGHHIVAEGER